MNPQAESFFCRFATTRIGVLGDFLIDEFVFGEISRLSREAPVLILRYQETRVCPGGAANTVANVAALGATAVPVGVLGDDRGADELDGLWPENVERSGILRDRQSRTTRKSRILAGSFHSFQQQVVRIDYENPLALSGALQKRVMRELDRLIPTLDALIISDYSLGNVTPAIKRHATAAARGAKIPLIIDSRDHPSKFPGATTVTPNITEVEASLRTTIGQDLSRLEHYGEVARQAWKVETLLITRGKLGMSLFTDSGCLHIPTFGSLEAVDVTGAGDTVAAAFSTALAAGADCETAARLANVAGGLVVMKKGTSTISLDELRTAYKGDAL